MMQAYDMTGVECNGEDVLGSTGVTAYAGMSFVEGDILEGRGSFTLEDLALFRDADGRPAAIDTRVLREVIGPYLSNLDLSLNLSS